MASGASYDAMGDVLSDGLHTYQWDVEKRPTTIDSISVTYDALGRSVEQGSAGTFTQIEYSPTGFKMQLLHSQSFYKQFVPLPGGTEEVWQASRASPYYRHADWLGSSRFASTYSTRTMYNDLAYAPFGETYAASGSTGVTDISFAGNNEDTTTNLYDAQFREYGIQGRWPSPDPAGIAAANPANPQSWNRYAYVLNNPLALVDPSGLAGYYWFGDCLVFIYPAEPNGFGWRVVFCLDARGAGGGGNPNNFHHGGFSGNEKKDADKCESDFQNSTFGQVVSFFSALNIPDNLFEWFGLGGAKGVGVHALDKAEASASVTNYSLTKGSTTEAEVLTGSKVLGTAGLIALGLATGFDAEMRLGCHDPSAAISMGTPILAPIP